jgi:hypothetical protein
VRGANGWYLQLDVRNFFNSIDRSRLLNMLEKRIYRRIRGEGADLLFYLCRALLETDPTANVHFQGAPHERERVPPHKRLGAAGPNKGLPIGNLSSQFFANVYLNELDQYVKHVLRCRHYLRYVDDFILLHRDPEVLLGWKRDIEIFLEETLDLRVKPEYRLHPVANGADFLGYIVRPRYLLVRRRVVGHLREKLRRWEKKFVIVPACCATAIKLAVIPAGMPESSVQGRQAEVLIVPTLQRGNAVGDAPASRCKSGRWSGQGGIPTLERGNDDKGKAAAGVDILRLSLGSRLPRRPARLPGQLSGPFWPRPPFPAGARDVPGVSLVGPAISRAAGIRDPTPRAEREKAGAGLQIPPPSLVASPRFRRQPAGAMAPFPPRLAGRANFSASGTLRLSVRRRRRSLRPAFRLAPVGGTALGVPRRPGFAPPRAGLVAATPAAARPPPRLGERGAPSTSRLETPGASYPHPIPLPQGEGGRFPLPAGEG